MVLTAIVFFFQVCSHVWMTAFCYGFCEHVNLIMIVPISCLSIIIRYVLIMSISFVISPHQLSSMSMKMVWFVHSQRGHQRDVDFTTIDQVMATFYSVIKVQNIHWTTRAHQWIAYHPVMMEPCLNVWIHWLKLLILSVASNYTYLGISCFYKLGQL